MKIEMDKQRNAQQTYINTLEAMNKMVQNQEQNKTEKR